MQHGLEMDVFEDGYRHVGLVEAREQGERTGAGHHLTVQGQGAVGQLQRLPAIQHTPHKRQ